MTAKIENYYKNQSVFKVNINYGNHMDVASQYLAHLIYNPITIERLQLEKIYRIFRKRKKNIIKESKGVINRATLGLQDFTIK